MTGKTAKGSALRVAQSLEAHSLLAIVFGGLIYILAVTGTLAVFNHDLQRWEQPHVPEMTSISPQAARCTIGRNRRTRSSTSSREEVA